jgi:hypothetical protein
MNTLIRFALIAILGVQATHAAISSDQDVASVVLTGNQSGLISVPNGTASGTFSFLVDTAGDLRISVDGSVGGLVVRIRTPSGAWLGEAEILAAEGQFLRLPGTPEGVPPQPSNRYFIRVSDALPGEHLLEVSNPAPGAAEFAAVVGVEQASPVKMAVSSQTTDSLVRNRSLIMAALFADALPVESATVTAKLVTPQGTGPQTLTLVDEMTIDGQQVRDGLYVAEIPLLLLQQPGEYVVRFEATGTTAAGLPFRRTAGEIFTLNEIGAVFEGLSITEPPVTTIFHSINPLDCDLNKIRIRTQANVSIAGTYRVEYEISDADGDTVRREKVSTLGVGVHDLVVEIEAGSVDALDLSGFVKLTKATLFRQTESGNEVIADRLGELPVSSVAIHAPCPPKVRLGEITGMMALDQYPPSGSYDTMGVIIEVAVRENGLYRVRAGLNRCGVRASSIDVTQYLSGGGAMQQVWLPFPGEPIGKAGMQGPWELSDVLVWNVTDPNQDINTGGFDRRGNMGEVRPLNGEVVPIDPDSFVSVERFEGYDYGRPPLFPDRDADGVPDHCVIFYGPRLDINRDGVPDPDDQTRVAGCIDFDANYLVNLDDLTAFITEFYTRPYRRLPCLDYERDRQINLDDLSLFITDYYNWVQEFGKPTQCFWDPNNQEWRCCTYDPAIARWDCE